MTRRERLQSRTRVALLAEGVDRNTLHPDKAAVSRWSPSSRRAWIEITSCNAFVSAVLVALLAEGVDRNKTIWWVGDLIGGRPPRGGRG